MLKNLKSSELCVDGEPLSNEEKRILSDYNQRVDAGEIFSYEETVDDVLQRLLVLRPLNLALLLCRIDLLSLKHQAPYQNDELLCTLNTLLSLESFLSDDVMNFEQIRMRALRSQIYLEKQAPDIALPDLAYIIEHVHPVQEEHYLFHFYYDALYERSKIFKAQGKLEEELSDLNALLTPPALYSQKHFLYAPYGNLHHYSRASLFRRCEIFIAQENYDNALRDLDALLNEDSEDTPALVLRGQVYHALNDQARAMSDEVAVRDRMLLSLENAEQNKAIPSLQTLAKITFFRHEAKMNTSEWVASNPTEVREIFKATGITPDMLHRMRELLYIEEPGEKTVFDDLAMHEEHEHEDVTDNKKRKHSAISPSMS
ncbi:MAG: hypothetical protein P1U39_01045 [Legionellaceae bacterium]|nr:hypothetical protein [Legionellaceae bacterium]